jgi:hypothetical protein
LIQNGIAIGPAARLPAPLPSSATAANYVKRRKDIVFAPNCNPPRSNIGIPKVVKFLNKLTLREYW